LTAPAIPEHAPDRFVGDWLPGQPPSRRSLGSRSVSSPSTASVTTTTHASVRRYPASTPVVEAIATELTASPTCARSSFVTRGSRETAYRSSSSARRTLSSTGIAALASSNRSSGAASSAPGSPLCSSDSRGPVVAGAADGGGDLLQRGVRRPGVPQPAAGDHPHPDAAGLRERHPLHLAAERLHLGRAALLGVGLDLLARLRRVDGGPDQVAQLRHRCPPR
jgi:hypothetical protein